MSDAIRNEWKLREEICTVGMRLYDQLMVAGNDGNISVRLGDDEVLITPSGVSKGMLTPEMMIRMRCNGEIIDAPSGFKPSSERHIHLVVYENRPEIGAVIHAHPATATGMAVAGLSMEKPFLPEAIVRTGPVPLAPYTLPGGSELSELADSLPTHRESITDGQPRRAGLRQYPVGGTGQHGDGRAERPDAPRRDTVRQR